MRAVLSAVVASAVALAPLTASAESSGYAIYSLGVGNVSCGEAADKADSLQLRSWMLGVWTALNAMPSSPDHITGSDLTEDQIMQRVMTVCFAHPNWSTVDVVAATYFYVMKHPQ